MGIGKPFLPGRAKTGGRVRGSRNAISEKFLRDVALEWEKSGPAALAIIAKEDPGLLIKVVAGILPKEFSVEDNRLKDLDDSELEILINELRGKLRRAFVADIGSGEKPTAH